MADLPEGVVTFLFTDVEGSTRLWEEAPDSMMEALQQHDEAIEASATAHHGVPVRPRGEGDSRFVVFPAAADAVAAAADVQQRLAEIDWATREPLRVRVAVHTGDADLQLGDYYGTSVNRAARLRGIAHGGQTLMSAATWELVHDHLPEEVAVRDMGEHRLKDLTKPEHVYQIDVDGLDEQFPPLASLDAVPNNLPLQLTDFVGRPEVGDVKRIVGETRLLTILAPGGAGKTRLAIQAAAELTDDYPDGVFFIDLAPVTSPSDIAQAAAESIGVALATQEDLQTQLLAHLANERQLLIFDNFEHLVDGVGIVSQILIAAPQVKVIATSRIKLSITGETVFTLPGLEITWNTPDEAFRASGVHLFIDAGKRADASFSLKVDDLDPLARILDLVDGFPLGILLAAAWVGTLGVGEIAAEIDRSMDILESDVADVPDRHRSMRAVFDYSWAMLSEEDRRLFAALSVFRGGFTREAAEEVAGASLRSLANLAGKSLIVSDRETGRYTVHELLRQYAEEELHRDTTERDGVIAAHTAFYEDVGAAAEEIAIHGDVGPALTMIEADLDNVRSAFRRTLAHGDAAAARRFVIGLLYLHEVRGWTRAGVELFGEAREAFAAGSDDDAVKIMHAVAAVGQAKFMANLGQSDAAALAAEAVATLNKLSDPPALLVALELQCEVLVYGGASAEVLARCAEAMRVADEAGLEAWSAGMKNYQVLPLLEQGDLESAIRLLEESDAVLARLDEHFMRAWNLEIRAQLAMMQDRFDDAVALRNLEVELAQEVGYVRVIAMSLHGLGASHAATGDLTAARAALWESLERFEHMGLVVEMAAVMVSIARVLAEQGSTEEAVAILACVRADPASEQQFVAEQVTINEAATTALTGLEEALDSEVYAAAHARGATTSLDVMVKELLIESDL